MLLHSNFGPVALSIRPLAARGVAWCTSSAAHCLRATSSMISPLPWCSAWAG